MRSPWGPVAASSRGQHVIATGLAHAIEQYFAPLTVSPAGHRSQPMPGLG